MPRRDGTGPTGAGAMTGRGLGACTGAEAVNYGGGRGRGIGLGRGCGRGFGRGFGRGLGQGYGSGIGRGFGRGFVASQISAENRKELLEAEKAALQERLGSIDAQLENL